MNIRATLTVVLCLPLLLLRTGPSQAQPGNPPVQQPAGADRALVFRTTGHLAAFLPGRTCLATLDHALCVEFIDGVGTVPQSATSSTPTAAAGLVDGPLPLDEVRYEALWPGIDLVYSGEGGKAKATYLVAPGADPNSIRLRYNMPATVQPDGSLRFEPTSGRGVLTESAPVAWQEIGGRRVPVDVGFVVSGDSAVSFRLGAYDPRYPLTIDPTYAWHTFYGSGGTDWCQDIVVDGGGNIYVVGEAYETWLGDGSTEPLHAHSPGSNLDLVVLKLGPDGGYLWHTFYGSSVDDEGFGVAVDEAGDLYVTGFSNATWNGSGGEPPLHAHTGSADVVVLKLDSNGIYQWHTFYGSNSYLDAGTALALDGMGGLYVTGYSLDTWQGDGDTAALHPYAGDNEAMVLKLNTDGAYQWHTFYGSVSRERGCDVAIDEAGSVYVSGSSSGTWQGDGNQDPLHSYTAGGNRDMVVLKLDGNGAYQWHTFYGGSDSDMMEYSMELAVDAINGVYVVGVSNATWQGDGGMEPLHPHSGGGYYDIVVLNLNTNGAYQWHTFHGSGSGDDTGPDVAVSAAGNIYVVGQSATTWAGNGGEPPLHAHSGVPNDAVILKLNPSGTYLWHTFYGPHSNSDDALDIALDNAGNIHVTGEGIYTWQGDGGVEPLHPYSGDADLMVLKLAGDTETSVNPIAGGTLVFTNTQGLTTTLQVPPGAVSQCTDLVYTPLFTPTETLDPGEVYAQHAFFLHAYPCANVWHVYLPIMRWGWYLPLVMRDVTSGTLPAGPTTAPFLAPGDPVFQEPVTMTLHYSDTDVTGIDENTLRVVYWTGSTWEDMAGTCGTPVAYDRDLDNNRLSFSFCHMSQGALVGN